MSQQVQQLLSLGFCPGLGTLLVHLALELQLKLLLSLYMCLLGRALQMRLATPTCDEST